MTDTVKNVETRVIPEKAKKKTEEAVTSLLQSQQGIKDAIKTTDANMANRVEEVATKFSDILEARLREGDESRVIIEEIAKMKGQLDSLYIDFQSHQNVFVEEFQTELLR